MSGDLLIVGAGPAGSAAAIGALQADPSLRVTLLDRATFPRDKPCGDGVAPHVVDVLTEAGVTGLVDDLVPVHRLQLGRGSVHVGRTMRRPGWVVPRRVLDARLVDAAQRLGAELEHHRVRRVRTSAGEVEVDDRRADVVVGADGAYSVVAPATATRRGRRAVAVRGYAPVPATRAGAQVIAFGSGRQPAYAWSFDRGDGLANVGYGELLTARRARPTRAGMIDRLEALLPGATDGADDWRGHLLPLSSVRWRPAPGRVLLAGDAAGLVNPMTGEGLFYAVATGLAAGRAAAAAVAAGDPTSAGARYAATTHPLLARHLRHTASAAALCRVGPVLDAGLRASAVDQRVFDDLVELGLARGRITPTVLRGLALATTRRPAADHPAHQPTLPPTAS